MAFGDFVQDDSDAQKVTYFSLTLPSTPTEGNLGVIVSVTRAASQVTPSGWSLAKSQDDTGNADNISIFYKVFGSGESQSVQVRDNSDPQVLLAHVAEYEGPWNATPLDKTNGANDSNSDSVQPGTTGTLSQADELIIAGGTLRELQDDITSSSCDSSFTERLDAIDCRLGYAINNQSSLAVYSKLVSATTAENPTISWAGSPSTDIEIGVIATFKKSAAGGAYTLTCAQGSITTTGQTVGLVADRSLALAQGSYTLTGQTVNLNRGYTLALAQGSYTLTGQTVGLVADRSLALAQGSYTLTGQDVTLTYTPTAGAYTLVCAQGSIAVTGQTVGLAADRSLALAQGSYTLTGQTVTLVAARTLTLAQGSYTLSGQTIALIIARTLVIVYGSYVLSGQSITLSYSESPAPVTPTSRTIPVSAETRTVVVAAENRTAVIASENRTYPAE